jgi:hypothetical protein
MRRHSVDEWLAVCRHLGVEPEPEIVERERRLEDNYYAAKCAEDEFDRKQLGY